MQKTALFLFVLPLFCLLPACKSTQSLSQSHTRYLPSPLRNLYFGMPLKDAEKVRDLQPVDEGLMDFRIVRLETPKSGDIASIGYYFDAEGEQPLYELILNYHSSAARDREAEDLLGPPNHAEGEWRHDTPEGFAIRAWKFQNKLVIVGTLAGTEWENE